jgi:hypothetical protein
MQKRTKKRGLWVAVYEMTGEPCLIAAENQHDPNLFFHDLAYVLFRVRF